MSLTDLIVPTFTQMLSNLSAWLDKASAMRDPDALMSLRLADDMYPLAAQVRFACFQAQEPLLRLRSEQLPETLHAVREEGWAAGERPGTFKDAQARIAQALDFLKQQPPRAVDRTETMPFALDLPNGMVFEMTGAQYVRDWALPQFYFHVMTAYAILRHHGVNLGKADYVSHMLAYMRPHPTMTA